jgi:hypothetical protein
MVTQFSRPENPVELADQDELMRFLDQHNVNYRKWKNDRFAEFWEEFASSDMLITAELIPGTETVSVFRNIRTVTVRITCERHDDPSALNPTVLVLVEYLRGKDGSLLPRKHPHSSVTEKLHWNRPGHEERPAGAIVRVFQEELGITLTHGHLTFDENLFRVPVLLRRAMADLVPKSEEKLLLDLSDKYKREVDEHLERGIDLDIRWSGDDKYPGSVTRNQLVHYWLKLPPELYQEEGYVESKGKCQSLWELSAPVT